MAEIIQGENKMEATLSPMLVYSNQNKADSPSRLPSPYFGLAFLNTQLALRLTDASKNDTGFSLVLLRFAEIPNKSLKNKNTAPN